MTLDPNVHLSQSSFLGSVQEFSELTFHGYGRGFNGLFTRTTGCMKNVRRGRRQGQYSSIIWAYFVAAVACGGHFSLYFLDERLSIFVHPLKGSTRAIKIPTFMLLNGLKIFVNVHGTARE